MGAWKSVAKIQIEHDIMAIAGRQNRIQASTQRNEGLAATWNEDPELRRPQEKLLQVGTLVAEDRLRDEAQPDLSYTDGSQCICLWLA